MLNGPCHIHSVFVDGKRVSRHAMKDCTTVVTSPFKDDDPCAFQC
jgi:hypothetical protein